VAGEEERNTEAHCGVVDLQQYFYTIFDESNDDDRKEAFGGGPVTKTTQK